MRGVTFDDIVAMTADWPGVETGTSYGTPALKVAKKSFARMWSEREHDRDGVHDTEVLVVFCDLEEKPALIESFGGVVFETPHYEGYGAMLIRLADVDRDDLIGFLEDSYRLKATARLVREFDA